MHSTSTVEVVQTERITQLDGASQWHADTQPLLQANYTTNTKHCPYPIGKTILVVMLISRIIDVNLSQILIHLEQKTMSVGCNNLTESKSIYKWQQQMSRWQVTIMCLLFSVRFGISGSMECRNSIPRATSRAKRSAWFWSTTMPSTSSTPHSLIAFHVIQSAQQ